MRRNWERSLQHNELASGPLSPLLAPEEFVDDGVFLTRDGYLGIVCKLDPVPWECLVGKDEETDAMDEIVAHFRRLLPRFDAEMRIYQYAERLSNPEIIAGTGERRSFLESRRPEMYSIQVHYAVVYEIKREAKASARSAKAEARLDKEIMLDTRRLRICMDGFVSGIGMHVKASLLNKDQAFTFLAGLVNYSRSASKKRLARDWDLARQMSDSNIDIDPVLRVGAQYVRVWTLKELSQITRAHHLRALAELPCDSMIVTEWRSRSISHTRKHVKNAKNKLSWTKENMTANLSTKPIATDQRVIDEEKEDEQTELGQVQKAMRKEVWFGDFALTIIIHGSDPEKLAPAAAKAEECLLLSGGSVVEQTGFSALFSWLSIIPGNSKAYSLWTQRVSNENYADMSWLFGPPVGERWNSHLDAECLTVLESRLGTQYGLNLHRSPSGGRPESGHFMVTGKPRSGKSFLSASVLEQYQKYGPFTVVFDTTSGFRILTERFGGAYFQIGRRDGETTINPFCLPETAENCDFLFSLIRMMIEADKDGHLSSDEVGILHGQIGEVYGLRESRRCLGELALPRRLANRLARWRNGGQYGYLFDNPLDTLQFGTWTAFEFPDMRNDPEALDTLMYYATVRCDREVRARSPQPGIIFLDEGWEFLRREDSKSFLVRAAKAWPKLNAVLGIATHSLYDMDDRSVRAIMESCVTRIHASNPDINEKEWQDAFHLTPAETAIIRGLEPQREYLVQGDGVVRLYVDQISRLRFSNSSQSAAEREKFTALHGADSLTRGGQNEIGINGHGVQPTGVR